MIDFNTHPVQIAEFTDADPDLPRAIRDVFGFYVRPQPLSTFLGHLDAAGLERAVVLPLDCSSAHRTTIGTSEQMARLGQLTDRVVPFASVDPGAPGAADELRRAVRELGLRGLSLDPSLQRFDVASDGAGEVFAACRELDVPAVVQAGLNWSPHARSFNPLELEPVLADHPGLRLVIPHFGWPWVSEALMLAVKYPTVMLDTSVLFAGTPEQSLGRVVRQQVGVDIVNGPLADQVVFGSAYPRVDPKRVRWAVDALGLEPQAHEKIMSRNGRRLLGGTLA